MPRVISTVNGAPPATTFRPKKNGVTPGSSITSSESHAAPEAGGMTTPSSTLFVPGKNDVDGGSTRIADEDDVTEPKIGLPALCWPFTWTFVNWYTRFPRGGSIGSPFHTTCDP